MTGNNYTSSTRLDCVSIQVPLFSYLKIDFRRSFPPIGIRSSERLTKTAISVEIPALVEKCVFKMNITFIFMFSV